MKWLTNSSGKLADEFTLYVSFREFGGEIEIIFSKTNNSYLHLYLQGDYIKLCRNIKGDEENLSLFHNCHTKSIDNLQIYYSKKRLKLQVDGEIIWDFDIVLEISGEFEFYNPNQNNTNQNNTNQNNPNQNNTNQNNINENNSNENNLSQNNSNQNNSNKNKVIINDVYLFSGEMLLACDFYHSRCGAVNGGVIDEAKGLILGEGERAKLAHFNYKNSPLCVCEYSVCKKVKNAVITVAALGWYELYINGEKADNRVLGGANTNYDKRILYDEYSVTEKILQGGNCFGVWLGNGYDSNYSKYGYKYLGKKAFYFKLVITYEDNSVCVIDSESPWKCGNSPILYNDIYNGEYFDNNYFQPKWCQAEYDHSMWSLCENIEVETDEFQLNKMPKIAVVQEFEGDIINRENGCLLVDFKQNFAGMVKLEIKGSKGDKIRVRYGEEVKNNQLYTHTNRFARSCDTYICSGVGREIYVPKFTYHGFRFVEISLEKNSLAENSLAENSLAKNNLERINLEKNSLEEINYTAEILSVTGLAICADLEKVGSFTSSNPTLNKIYNNAIWSIKSNLMSVPTDCCMRSERTPCMMDSATSEEMVMYSFGAKEYYKKWFEDIKDDLSNCSPDWGGDIISLGYNIYWYYNDVDFLRYAYFYMKKFMLKSMDTMQSNLCVGGFGDWCAPNNGTWSGYFKEPDFVNSALMVHYLELMSKTQKALSIDDDYFIKCGEKVKCAINEKYFNGNSYGESQTANILALSFNIVDNQEIGEKVAANLVEIIKSTGHLDTGIYSTKYLLFVLAKYGYCQMAVDILCTDTYPSFGYQIKEGATTLWEQWHKQCDMGSHNHYMFCGIVKDFYSILGGITFEKPGCNGVVIKPYFAENLDNLKCSSNGVTVSFRQIKHNSKTKMATENKAEITTESSTENAAVSENRAITAAKTATETATENVTEATTEATTEIEIEITSEKEGILVLPGKSYEIKVGKQAYTAVYSHNLL